MKFDDNNADTLSDQLILLNIDETFYAYEYFISYNHGLVVRFSNHYLIPSYLSCFLDTQIKHELSVENALHSRLRTHALAALLLTNVDDINPLNCTIKLLAINAALKGEVSYNCQEFHLLRSYLDKNKMHHRTLIGNADYTNSFIFIKNNVDILFVKQEVKNFIERLLEIYLASPFKEKAEDKSEIHRSKREEQIQRTRYTSQTILTDSESRELAKTLESSFESGKESISTLLIISRIFSISVEEAYSFISSNFENIKSNSSIVKPLTNPKSIVNKSYYEISNDSVSLTLPSLIITYISSLNEMFDQPRMSAVDSFIDKMKRGSKALNRITITF